MKVAFISGTSIIDSDLFETWTVKTVETAFGPVAYKTQGDYVLINRHSYGVLLPPHAINHRANLRALADLGFKDIVSLCSVGSLKPDLHPGALVSCSDYVCFQQGPLTFYDRELTASAPIIANNLIPMLVAKLSPDFSIHTDKIYVQTRGPRFETKAEIQILKGWGDVVGMTAAHEADLCAEIGLRYNSLAMVANYANGLMAQDIDCEKFRKSVKAHQQKVNRLFTRLLEILA